MKRSQNPWTHTVTVDVQRRCTSRIGPSGPKGKVWAPSVDALANSPEGAPLHKEWVTDSEVAGRDRSSLVWQNAPATSARRARLPASASSASNLLRGAFRLRALFLGRAHARPGPRRSSCPNSARRDVGGKHGAPLAWIYFISSGEAKGLPLHRTHTYAHSHVITAK